MSRPTSSATDKSDFNDPVIYLSVSIDTVDDSLAIIRTTRNGFTRFNDQLKNSLEQILIQHLIINLGVECDSVTVKQQSFSNLPNGISSLLIECSRCVKADESHDECKGDSCAGECCAHDNEFLVRLTAHMLH